jgi:hypothetical protein
MTEKERWKPVLDDSGANRELAFVVDKTNYIEFTLKSILTKYIAARDNRTTFINDILLHSTIVGLGQKFRLLHYIAEREKWPKIDQKHFHTILNIRNAFAHSDTVSHHTVIRQREDGATEVVDSFQLLETISSSGTYREVKRKDALDEFTQSYVIVRDHLHDIDTYYADSSRSPRRSD